jgi:YbbR domain-containing protein
MRDRKERRDNDVRYRQRMDNALKVAKKSQTVINNNYNAVSSRFARVFKAFNDRLDFIITNGITAKLLSIIMAVLLFVAVNYSGNVSVLGETSVGKVLNNVPITAIYDRNKYEVENLPKSVSASLVGTMDGIRKTEQLNKYKFIADLSNYTAGDNQNVRLIYAGIADGVTVKFDQPDFNVNIYPKVEREFIMEGEMINLPPNSLYDYKVKTLTQDRIKIRASQKTLDKVGSVRILVDANNQDKDFSATGNVVVFDKQGNKMMDLTLPFKQVKVKVDVKKKKTRSK